MKIVGFVKTMVEKLGFAIAGLHNWYHTFPYAMSFKHIPSAELVAVAHDNPEQLKDFSFRTGIKETSLDMQEVIRRKDVDAVIVNAYTSAHLGLVKVACEEGKHVLCDKPIETSLKRTLEMKRHVEKAGVKFMIGNEFRTLPVYRKVSEMLTEGVIDEIAQFDYSINAPLPRDWMSTPEPGWYGQPEKVGYGGFFDFSVQQFDLLRFLFRKEGIGITGITRNLVHKDLAVEDYGVAFTEFEGGISGIVESSWTVVPPGNFSESFILRGTEGSIVVEGSKIIASGRILKNTMGKAELNVGPAVNDIFKAVPGKIEIPIGIWYHLLSGFVNSINSDTDPPETILDGLKSLELAIATYESSKKQCRISVEEI